MRLEGTGSGEYLVKELSYFADVGFKMDSPGRSKSLSPHVTKQARLQLEGVIIFSLKRQYDLVSFTLEGVSGSVPPDGADFDLPAYDDGDPYKSGDDPTEPQELGGVDPTGTVEGTTNRAEPFD